MQKLQEQLKKMRGFINLNENFVQPDLTADYFLTRVPFFKSFNNISNDKAIGFQKVVYNSNVEANIGGGTHIFPNFNTVCEFNYTKYQRSDTTFNFVFYLKFGIIVTKPDNMNQLQYMAINIASRMAAENLSYIKEYINKTNISKEELDQTINEINGKLFQFEEYVNNHTMVDLKNPLDESIHPSEAYNNYDAIMTLVKGKRNVGQITYVKSGDTNTLNKGLTNNQLAKIINDAGLHAMKIKSNPYNNWIIYKPGFEKEAQELNALADKYGGFFPSKNAAPEDIKRIGQLLGYEQSAIDDFLNKNKQIQENLKKHIRTINEFVTNEVVYLKQYFSLTDQQKQQSLPHEFPYMFKDFLDVSGEEFTPPTHEFIDSDGITQPGDPYETFEIIDWVEQHNPKLFTSFAKWLKDNIDSHSLDIPDQEYPAWSFFGSPSLVKNQWMIHFTNDAYAIESQGFKYGVDDYTKLGLTTSLGEFDKKYGGYNFAYLISEFNRYYRSNHGYGNKYGNEAVIFRASGLRLWHHGDEEPQVIFYGKTATNIMAIEEGENKQFAIKSKKTGRILFESDDLKTIVFWIEKNYDQYRKHLI